MATLPASGYLSDNARTELEMKDALEDMRDVASQRLGYGSLETLVLSSDAILPTVASFIVQAEVGVTDDLATITTTNFVDGQIVRMVANTGHTITLTTAGNVVPPGGNDLIVANDRDAILLQLSGGFWYVVNVFRYLVATERDDLGLGDAALEDVGPGNGLDADTVDGEEAAAFATVASSRDAYTADRLGGIVAANYARKDVASEQLFVGALRTDSPLLTVKGSSPLINLRNAADDLAAQFTETGTDLEIVNHRPLAAGIASGIKLLDDVVPQWRNRAGTFYDFWSEGNDGAGSGLDADLIKGVDVDPTVGTSPASGKLIEEHTFTPVSDATFPESNGEVTIGDDEFWAQLDDSVHQFTFSGLTEGQARNLLGVQAWISNTTQILWAKITGWTVNNSNNIIVTVMGQANTTAGSDVTVSCVVRYLTLT